MTLATKKSAALPVRTDVPLTALPRQRGVLVRRDDIPPHEIAGSSKCAIATEWIGRGAAVLSAFVLFQVLQAVETGQDVQASGAGIVQNMKATNQMFDERADFAAASRARRQLQDLQQVLAELNASAAVDADLLARALPDLQRLLATVNNNSQLAGDLRSLGQELSTAAASIRATAVKADGTVKAASGELTTTLQLLDELNAVLARIERRLAPVPDLSGVTP